MHKYDSLQHTNVSRLLLATYLAALSHTDEATSLFKSVDVDKSDFLRLAEYYLNIGDKEQAIHYFNKSYEQLKTDEQLLNWKRQWQQTFPRDFWASVRNEGWFKSATELRVTK
jgi:tetratricopeptide (TPR) repeat protein